MANDALPSRVEFRPGQLAGALACRGDNHNEIARRDLERYYNAIEDALREVQLSRNEWMFLRDLLNSTYIDSDLATHLWLEVQDADDAIAQQWGIDRDDLAGRIQTMPLFARLAICDAVERWWLKRPE